MNFSIEEREAFKEVNEIIDLMGQEYRNKIPNKLLELLQKEQDREYQTKIKKGLPFEKQIISRTALVLLNYINTNYWLEEEKKKEIRDSYLVNEEKYQNELRKKYKPNDLFKKKQQ